jgi:class 3 adenylate cyclase
MFADLVGFTAWSSVREPTQVFVLLETLFREFDKIAKRRRIFKVETVGDCYGKLDFALLPVVHCECKPSILTLDNVSCVQSR